MTANTRIELDTAGTVWKLLVKPGDSVAQYQPLFIMEVMKMEVPYDSPVAGTVLAVNIAEGDVVEEGLVAVEIGA